MRSDIPLRFCASGVKVLALASRFDHKLASPSLGFMSGLVEIPAGAGRCAVHVFRLNEGRSSLKALITMRG
jgi:hypothetical protein